MKRFTMLMSVAALSAPLLVSAPTKAQTAAQSGVKPKSSARLEVNHPSMGDTDHQQDTGFHSVLRPH